MSYQVRHLCKTCANVLRRTNGQCILLRTPGEVKRIHQHSSNHHARFFSSASESQVDSMSAWQIYDYSGIDGLVYSKSLKLKPLDKPTDVLVQVHASSVNPIDVMMIGGYGASTLNPLRKAAGGFKHNTEFPLIPGRDFSGVVIATGSKVPPNQFKPGDEVYGAGVAHRQGTHATHYVVGAGEISKKPKSMTHNEAASIPYVATTSWSALCSVGRLNEQNSKNKRILITGASGGVGTFAIQLLKSWGAELTVTCSQDAHDLVRNLGADVVLDYKDSSFDKDLQELAGFDFIYNTVQPKSMDSLMQLLKRNANATCVSIVVPFLRNNDKYGLPLGLAKSLLQLGKSSLETVRDGRNYRWAVFVPNGLALQRIARLIDKGDIRPVIEKTYDFSEMKEAYSHVAEKHSRGKTVIEVVR